MHASIINICLAFFEGFALIISPCILPILPIVLSGSLTGNKTRPLGIIAGFIFTFAIVTLFSRALINFFHIDPEIMRNVSFILLLFFGIVLFSTTLSELFTRVTQSFANLSNSIKTPNQQQGFLSGFVFGSLIGFVWTPCAGPLLAVVIVQSVVQTTTLSSILIVIAFGIGAGVPMLMIAYFGRKIIDKMFFFRKNPLFLRKILGILIILSVIALVYSPYQFFTGEVKQVSDSKISSLQNGMASPYQAPPLEDITGWINTGPLQLKQLRGKVVLVDFWAYSCINCIRTLPYLKNWYTKYHAQGLEIIGVHSPEFQFEQALSNVQKAVEKNAIKYPVALDNHFATWKSFHNQYWPAHYLINQNGDVVYEHFGEGDYDVTENNIRYLLGLKSETDKGAEVIHSADKQTPETYLGHERATKFSSPDILKKNQIASYHYPKTLAVDAWALQGEWTIFTDKVVSAQAGASIRLHYQAGKIYAVMGTQNGPVQLQILLDGKKFGKSIQVINHDLYELADFQKTTDGVIELIVSAVGLEIYTFTFGH